MLHRKANRLLCSHEQLTKKLAAKNNRKTAKVGRFFLGRLFVTQQYPPFLSIVCHCPKFYLFMPLAFDATVDNYIPFVSLSWDSRMLVSSLRTKMDSSSNGGCDLSIVR